MSTPLDDVEGDFDTGNTPEPETTPTPTEEQKGNSDGIIKYLTASTGSGGLEEYQDTPLNPDNDEGLAQIIRGLSGLASRKVDDFAVLDIGLGAFKFLRPDENQEEKERAEKNGIEQTDSSEA